MKSLCLVLLLAMSMPGCSSFSKTARTERAYYKSLEKAKVAREKSRKKLLKQQRAAPRMPHSTPPPLQQQTVQPAPENQ